ncbi:MAG: hypothetical protein ACKOHK_13695, partial [Planctomycetia bacterium]
ATRTSRNEDAWPLSEEAASTQRQKKQSWISLAIGAVCLLAALIFNPKSKLVEGLCESSEAVKAVCLFGCLGLLLAAIVAFLFAFTGLLARPSRGRMLGAGDFLGKGPYRRYACGPTVPLLEGIAASIDTATAHLPAADRTRASGLVARARQQAAEGAFHDAVTTAAEAIAIHTRAVESARSDETIRGPAGTAPRPHT